MGKKTTTKVAKKKERKPRKRGFLRGVMSELKKVTWPSRKELGKFTLIVVVVVVVFAAIVGVMDFLFGELLRLITGQEGGSKQGYDPLFMSDIDKDQKNLLEQGTDQEAVDQDTDQEKKEQGKWYVVHTYSGYENKVKVNLEKIIENRNLQDLILEVKVPVEEQIEIKDGKRKAITRKLYPGYVIVKMIMTDESWYIIRNTRGVTGFVGPGSKPIPLTDREVLAMGVEDIPIVLDAEVGDNIRVISGPLENFIGIIEEIYPDKQKVKVSVSMFGRDTPVELEYNQIQKIQV